MSKFALETLALAYLRLLWHARDARKGEGDGIDPHVIEHTAGMVERSVEALSKEAGLSIEEVEAMFAPGRLAA
jgi:hypothetical protein